MLTINDLYRFESWARQSKHTYAGRMYRFAMRLLLQRNLHLAEKALLCITKEFTSSGRVNIQAHERLASIYATFCQPERCEFHLRDAMDGYKWIANHQDR